MGPIPKFFIIAGVALIAVGLLWEYGGQFFPWGKHLGRLPGDIVVERPGFQFYFPLATSLIVSVVLSLIFYLFRSK